MQQYLGGGWRVVEQQIKIWFRNGIIFSTVIINPTRQPNIEIIIQNTAIIYGLVILTGQGHGPQRV